MEDTSVARNSFLHVIIDGYGNDRQKLQDLRLVYDVLDTFPSRIGMTKIMPPFVIAYNALKLEDSGISGFVIIAQSHISLHTFPYKDLVYIDIVSCSEFAPEQAVSFFSDRLQLKDTRVEILRRVL